tara:strand:+ start:2221 stop:2985 length:765 start_codon:yes stop_codon:yes gene_type:complete
MGKLSGRTALITGASRGIGSAIAQRFAAEGANVAINCARDESAANEVSNHINNLGVKSFVYRANIADEKECVRMIDAAIKDFGQIDALICNAGIGSAAINRPAIADATNEQWDTILDVNLWGPIYLCRGLVPHLRKAQRSDIVVLSSTAVQMLKPGSGVYSVSKAALETMAHTMAREERVHGMRVNIIAPGLVDTDMGRKVVEAVGGPSDIRELDEDMPFGFVCTPEDIAASVAHLCSEDGRYITNQRITIAGD